MYSVVVCPQCENVWIVKDHPKTTQCTRCAHTRKLKRFKKYAEDVSKEKATAIRASALAKQNDREEMFQRATENTAMFEDQSSKVDSNAVPEKEGLDIDAIEEAGEADSPTESRSDQQVMADAFQKLETPTQDEVVDYATRNGVPSQKAETVVEKFLMSGKIYRTGDGFQWA